MTPRREDDKGATAKLDREAPRPARETPAGTLRDPLDAWVSGPRRPQRDDGTDCRFLHCLLGGAERVQANNEEPALRAAPIGAMG
jgi:hypothetical protein